MMATAAHSTSTPARFAIPQTHDSRDAKDLRTRVNQALNRGDRHLVIDCGAWSRVELNMLSLLIQCVAACREHGASFELANMSNEVRADVLALQLGGRLGFSE